MKKIHEIGAEFVKDYKVYEANFVEWVKIPRVENGFNLKEGMMACYDENNNPLHFVILSFGADKTGHHRYEEYLLGFVLNDENEWEFIKICENDGYNNKYDGFKKFELDE